MKLKLADLKNQSVSLSPELTSIFNSKSSSSSIWSSAGLPS